MVVVSVVGMWGSRRTRRNDFWMTTLWTKRRSIGSTVRRRATVSRGKSKSTSGQGCQRRKWWRRRRLEVCLPDQFDHPGVIKKTVRFSRGDEVVSGSCFAASGVPRSKRRRGDVCPQGFAERHGARLPELACGRTAQRPSAGPRREPRRRPQRYAQVGYSASRPCNSASIRSAIFCAGSRSWVVAQSAAYP